MAKTDRGAFSQLVDKVSDRVEAGEPISVGMIQQLAGQRAAGPLMLFPALVVVSPLSIIPGLPTLVGINTILIASQILLNRNKIWLPGWLRSRAVPEKYGSRLVEFLKPVGASIDAVAQRRWPKVGKILRRFGAAVCAVVGAIMPLLEFIPFTSTVAASVIAVYALAITARDGLLALVWVALLAGVVGVAALLVT